MEVPFLLVDLGQLRCHVLDLLLWIGQVALLGLLRRRHLGEALQGAKQETSILPLQQ